MKKILKIILGLIGVLVLFVGLLLALLTLNDYKPGAVEGLKIQRDQNQEAGGDGPFTVYTWNIGFGGMGDQEDFFMDGGDQVIVDSKEVVEGYMAGILSTLDDMDGDFMLIQEIDIESKRSYKMNQLKIISDQLESYSYSFAKNYDVFYVPGPIPPLGKVKSGLATFSKFKVSEAKRHSFNSNFSWPTKTFMLDRCFIVSRINLTDRQGDLYMINAHFSAYDGGDLKAEQLDFVKDFIQDLYKEGHYVVLGGDWNQTFASVDVDQYPLYDQGRIFTPYIIPGDWLDAGWSYGVADNAPTYRLLSGAYEPGVTQTGVIDGFVVSPNVMIDSVRVLDLEFQNSDHNPVELIFRLKE